MTSPSPDSIATGSGEGLSSTSKRPAINTAPPAPARMYARVLADLESADFCAISSPVAVLPFLMSSINDFPWSAKYPEPAPSSRLPAVSPQPTLRAVALGLRGGSGTGDG